MRPWQGFLAQNPICFSKGDGILRRGGREYKFFCRVLGFCLYHAPCGDVRNSKNMERNAKEMRTHLVS